MTKEKEKRAAREQLLLESARLGRLEQLAEVLGQMRQLKCKKRSNPLASLRKTVGPNNIRDPVTGFTCLHHASLNGHSECVRLILEHGAKVNAVDYKGQAALHLAAWAGNLEVVKTLLAHQTVASGSPPNESQAAAEAPNRQSPTSGQVSKHQPLIDVDLCNNDNQTPLSLAAQFGHHQVVGELLARGANVHIRNNQLESPLDLACLNGRLETVDLLLSSSPSLVSELRKFHSTVLLGGQTDPPTVDRNMAPFGQRALSMSIEPTISPSNSSARRQSSSGSGWSSLLRGKHREPPSSSSSSAANASQQQQQQQQQQSPLHRFAANALSMRQRSSIEVNAAPAKSGGGQVFPNSPNTTTANNDEANNDEANNRERRRVTLTVGATFPIKQATNDQDSPEWANPNPSSNQALASSEHELRLASVLPELRQQVEKLLDHSPLHYATRRGHTNVVNLLVLTYQANIMQICSHGSVLHQIALNNGKHSDMIGLFFSYIVGKPEMLEAFLKLKDTRQRTVFELLNEMNNRSAQELKRLIYEFSEQIKQITNGMGGKDTQNEIGAQANSGKDLSSSQQQQQSQYKQHQQFSDIRQINSFVTMKRVPKNQQQQQQQQQIAAQRAPLHEVNDRFRQHQHSINSHILPPGSSFTIDRRSLRTKTRNDLELESQIANLELWKRNHVISTANGGQQGFGLFSGQQSVEELPSDSSMRSGATSMTRSVSNLNRAPIQQQHDERALIHEKEEEDAVWRQWLARACQSQPQPQSAAPNQSQAHLKSNNTPNLDLGAQAVVSRRQRPDVAQDPRRRSKSRDLGSLSIEAQIRMQTSGAGSSSSYSQTSEHLYDNGSQVGLTASPFENVPATSATASAHQLVRSQTDCSHLMGRFFGDHSALLGSDEKRTAPVHQAREQQTSLPQANATDRKLINRHYHVYDRQFYPPRLLGHQAPTESLVKQQQQHAMANSMQMQFARNDPYSSLRASTRSTVSTQSSKQPSAASRQHMTTGGHPQVNHCTRFNNSRLSLNVEPSQLSGGNNNNNNNMSTEELLAQQQHIMQQQQQQQHHQYRDQMDRFVCRHSRKANTSETQNSNSNLNANQWNLNPGTDVRRQDLLELQRRLAADSLNKQLQQQQLHNSHSLESHLSEPQLFESARKALMRDFDQMIGRELLNRGDDDKQLIDGRLPSFDSNGQSFLTGVQLDMDGDKLTVSGTRVTVPQEQFPSSNSISSSSNNKLVRTQQNVGPSAAAEANFDHELSERVSKINGQQMQNASSLAPTGDTVSAQVSQQRSNSSSINAATQTTPANSNKKERVGPCSSQLSNLEADSVRKGGGEEEDDDDCPREPPPKPPRLSLMEKKVSPNGRQKLTTSQKMAPDLQRAVIYDLPAPGTASLDEPRHSKDSLERSGANMRAQSASSYNHYSSQQQQQQMSSATRGINQLAKSVQPLTEPPKVRPPPPPPPQPSRTNTLALASPLHVVANSNQAVPPISGAMSGGSDHSNCSSAGSHEIIGLLKLAPGTSNNSSISSTNSSSSGAPARPPGPNRRPPLPANLYGGRLQPRTGQKNKDNNCNIRQQAVSKSDPDSGVCTSNSPASMSRESEGPSLPLSIATGHSVSISSSASSSVSATSSSSSASKKLKQESLDCPAIVRHQPTQRGLSLQRADTTSGTKAARAPSPSEFFGVERGNPPSPKTAQLCIEEALLPLEQFELSGVDVANQTSVSNQSTSTTANNDPNETPKGCLYILDTDEHTRGPIKAEHVNDYENCLALQRKLESIRISSIGNLFRETINRQSIGHEDENIDDEQAQLYSADAEDDDDDDDYAESISEDSHSSSSIEPDTEIGLSTATNRKEVLLKVVIDENESGANEGEVFYINPIELKRLAGNQKSAAQKIDAQTLTEEELCAAIDKESGFIRFTLRKRRNNNSQDSDADADVAEPLEQQRTEIKSSTKRTKLNEFLPVSLDSSRNSRQLLTSLENESQQEESTIGRIQNHELAQGDPNNNNNNINIDTKTNSTKLSSQIIEPTKSDEQKPIIIGRENRSFASGSATSWTSSNNNNNKQANVAKIRQWFSTKLVGLADYLIVFLENGFDDLQFLNHPTLLNDNLLKRIGIDDESHRLLIVERIGAELTRVEPSQLFESILLKSPQPDALISIQRLMETLQLSQLIEFEGQSTSARDSLEWLRKKGEDVQVPLGHRVRINLAANYLAGELNEAQEQVRNPLVAAQRASIESNEVEMDTSQASAASSSSKESIKSIVLTSASAAKRDTPEPMGSKQAAAANGTKSVQSELPNESEMDGEKEGEGKGKEVMPTGTDLNAKDLAPNEQSKPETDSDKEVAPRSFAGARRKISAGGSLVSEAARKLEEAAQKSEARGLYCLKPVAAARRINSAGSNNNGSKKSFDQSFGKPTADRIATKVALAREKSSCELERKFEQVESSGAGGGSSSSNEQPVVLKSGVRWPPKSLHVDSQVNQLDGEQKSSSSSEQLERRKLATAQTTNSAGANKVGVRPKPAPPAKPAKLAATNKLPSADLSSAQWL